MRRSAAGACCSSARRSRSARSRTGRSSSSSTGSTTAARRRRRARPWRSRAATERPRPVRGSPHRRRRGCHWRPWFRACAPPRPRPGHRRRRAILGACAPPRATRRRHRRRRPYGRRRSGRAWCRRAAARDRGQAFRPRIPAAAARRQTAACRRLYAMIFRVDQRLPALAARLRAARRVTVMTGAGVSAASGVPTFRGPGGLWRTYRPEDLATPDAFAYDPALVWEWYAWRREKVAACTPNAAHDVLARWSHRDPRGPGDAPGADPSDPRSQTVRVITQNVDDLHIRAGTRDLIRLHGSLSELRCFDGCGQGATPWRDERVPLPAAVPRCPYCGGRARTTVVSVGASVDPAHVQRPSHATARALFLTVGTSAVVYPAAGFARRAQAQGAFTAEINLEPTPASSVVDLSILGAAEEVLPALDQLLAPG